MDGSGTSHSFYFINTPHQSSTCLIIYPHVPRLSSQTKPRLSEPKENILTLPALPPLASSLRKTIYCERVAPCALYSQCNYCAIKKRKKNGELNITGT